MTALAVGASVTVSVRDGGTVAIATNGGSASALVAPTEGGSLSVGIGPLPERRTLGPYAEGASIVLTNANCGSFDYDVETRFDPSSVAITPTIADLGDSISWYNTDTATAGQDSYNSRGFLTQAVYLLRGRVDFPLSNNFGVSGETTAQMLARVAAVTTAKPGICTVMGGANDFNVPANLASAAASAAAFASITANLSAIYTALINAGIVVVAMCCAARGSWSALSAGEIIIARKLQIRVNRWIINQAAQHPNGRFYVARSDISIADYSTSTVNPLTGTTGDNLHPTGLGAFYLARYPKGGSLYDILDKILPPLTQEHFRTDIYDATDNPGGSLLTNPMPLGTAGVAGTGVTGSVASGMTISITSGTTLTAVASKVAATDNDGATIPQGGEFQRIVLGASGIGASSETLRVRLSVNAGASTYTAGDVLQAGIEIKQAGLANVLTQILAVNDFDGATNFLHYGNSGSGVGSDREPADCTRLIVSPEFTVRAYAGSGTQAINFDLLISCICSGSAPTGTIDIRHLYLRKRQLG